MACVHDASSVVPTSKKAKIDDIHTRVLRAFEDSGRRKLPTPLEMASRPVNDEPPLAYARNNVRKAKPIKSPLPWWPKRPSTKSLVAGWGIMCKVPANFL